MRPVIDADRLYTIRQAAALADVDRQQVWWWIMTGALPATQVGSQWRVRGADLLVPRRADGGPTGQAVVIHSGALDGDERGARPRARGRGWVRGLRNAAPAAGPAAIAHLLTPREREVLALLCRGLTRAQAAAALGIAEGTVDYHIRLILAATQLRTVRNVCRALEQEADQPDGD